MPPELSPRARPASSCGSPITARSAADGTRPGTEGRSATGWACGEPRHRTLAVRINAEKGLDQLLAARRAASGSPVPAGGSESEGAVEAAAAGGTRSVVPGRPAALYRLVMPRRSVVKRPARRSSGSDAVPIEDLPYLAAGRPILAPRADTAGCPARRHPSWSRQPEGRRGGARRPAWTQAWRTSVENAIRYRLPRLGRPRGRIASFSSAARGGAGGRRGRAEPC